MAQMTLDQIVDYALTDPGKRRDPKLIGCPEEQRAQLLGFCEFRRMIERAPVTDRVKIVSRINRMIARVDAKSSKESIALTNEWIGLANIAIEFCPDESI